ncbi:hypothetical protein [Halalkalibacter sp. APA_J-10(15)]|uniref:hypothetical protein n=1 Tax=Halalkalibacter sp. APA_J-10(15) TaxID=2933805 RepID=UPI001FF6F2F4|nr:hypothetical protein [Halalkalibacter sp. APA_J-10(15)]MCK0470866.1 hypothetical protein [Halalkalibacter sp. APA_J-10(15)]
MGRIQRQKLRSYEEIKGRVIQHLSYAQVNNFIFDEHYEKGKISEADLIIFIFLQLMHINKIALTKAEISKFLNISDRQIRDSIKKMSKTKGVTNAEYCRHKQTVEMKEPFEVNLITVKEHKAFNPDTRKSNKMDHFYVDFIPEVKSEEVDGQEIAVYQKFFSVHIDEFDFLREGILSRKEFVLYLFLNRIHNKDRKKLAYISITRLSERLNIKMPENTMRYIEKLLNLGLITETRPENYEFNIENGIEPSSHYMPVYNLQKINDANIKETDTKKQEVNFNSTEVNYDDVEEMFTDKEMESKFEENDYVKRESYSMDSEGELPF